jgi:putative DNA primase/helicase
VALLLELVDGRGVEATGMTAEVDLGWVSGHYPDADSSPAGEDAWPAPTDPLAVARHLVKVDSLHDEAGVLTVRWWRGSFHLWTGTHWVEVADPAVRARIYHLLEHAKYWKQDKDAGMELVPWAPTRRKVGDVLEALQAVVHLSERLDPPAWVDGAGDRHLVALQNGLLHLGTRGLQEHSPRLFNLNSLPYPYDPAALPPRRWLRFLRDLWPGDRESRRLLQEWFGYVLSGETNLHKILLLVGPPRSGKGTIARVLTALVGRANTAGPTLASLGQNFGLSPLLGKPLAVISDARLGGDTFTVVERLLSISGEDAITVDRKYRDPWTGRLPARFVVISNELPDLGDASGAIATRFLVLTLAKSWLGQEDPSLTDQLLEELPGILLWSLKGLDRLSERGHFTEPATSRDAVIALADLASPVAAFVREACTRDPGQEVPVKELYEAWRIWSKDHGRDRPTTEQRFGRDLRAAVPGLKAVRPNPGEGPRPRHYAGIALSDAYRAYVGAARSGEVRGPVWTGEVDKGEVREGPRTNPMWAAPEDVPEGWPQ